MARKMLTTPKGVAAYPKVCGTPGKKYNDWGVKLTVAGPEGVALAKEINAAAKAHLVEAQKNSKKKLSLAKMPYEKDENGNYVFNFRAVASGVGKKTGKAWSFTPVLYQANGTPWPQGETPRVGGGTVMRVMYEMEPWFEPNKDSQTGIKLKFAGCKIIKLVEWSQVSDEMKEDESELDEESTGPGAEKDTSTPAEPESDDF